MGLAAAAAAALLVTGVWQLRDPRSVNDRDVAAWQKESQTLESEWLRIANPGPGPVSLSGMARLRAIDATLQAAYDRGADAGEISPLWQQRNRALRGLIASVHDSGQSNQPADVTRI